MNRRWSTALVILTTLAVTPVGAAEFGADWPLPFQNAELNRTLTLDGAITSPALLWRKRLGGNNAPLLVQDVTGDGHTDVITLIGGRAICRSPETGALLWASTGLQLGFFLPDATGRARDLDGDGTIDILVSKESTGDTRIYALDGTTGKVLWTFGEGLGPASGNNGKNSAWYGDIDGDPGPEVVLYVPSNALGTFIYAFDFSTGFTEVTPAWQSESLGYNGNNVFSVFDATGDGVPEILMSSGPALFVVRLSDGTTLGSTLDAPWYGPDAPTIPYGAVLTPIQADSDAALEGLLTYGSVGLPGFFGVFDFDSSGAPTTLFRVDVTTRWLGGPTADLEGDGRPEVIASIWDGAWTTRAYDAATGSVKASLPGFVYAGATFDVDKNGTRELVVLDAPEEALSPLGLLNLARLEAGSFQFVFQAGLANTGLAAVAERIPGVEELIAYYDANADGRADALQALRVVGSEPALVGTYLFPKDLAVTWRGVFGPVVGTEAGQFVVFTNDGYFDTVSNVFQGIGQRVPTGGFTSGILTGALTTAGPKEAFVRDSAGRTLRVDLTTGSPDTPPDSSSLFVSTSGRTLMGLVDLEGDGLEREVLAFERVNGVDRFIALKSDGKSLRWAFTTVGLQGPPELGTFGTGGDVDGDGHLDLHVFTVVNNERIGFTLSGATGQQFPWSYRPFQLSAGNGVAYSPAILFDYDGNGSADVLQSRYADRTNGIESPTQEAPLSIRILDGMTGKRLASNNITIEPGRLVMTDVDGDPATREIVVGSWRQLGVLRVTPAGLETLWSTPSPGAIITRGIPMVLDLDGDGLNDIVHFDHTTGKVRARRGIDGSPLWPAGDGNVAGDVMLSEGRSWRLRTDASGYVDATDGEVRTTIAGLSLVDAAVAVSNLTGLGHPSIVFGGGDGRLYCVNGATGALDWAFDLGFSIAFVVATDLEGDGSVELLVSAGDGYLYAVGPAADLGTPGVPRDGLGDDIDVVNSYEEGINRTRFSANWDPPAGGSVPVEGYLVRLLTDTGAVVFDWLNVGDVTSVTIASGVQLVPGITYTVVVVPYSANGTGQISRSDGFIFADRDGDGVLDPDELVLGTNPDLADTDGDRIDDGIETQLGKPIDTDKDGTIDALDDDSDADTLSDLAEGTADTDGDTVADFRDEDDDGDSLLTSVEVLDGAVFGADPDADKVPAWRDEDSDNDGRPDVDELRVDLDVDGIPDYLDADDGTRPDEDLGPSGDVTVAGGDLAVVTGGGTRTESNGACGHSAAGSRWGLVVVGMLLVGLSAMRRRRPAPVLSKTPSTCKVGAPSGGEAPW